jgi:hypothetical protein
MDLSTGIAMVRPAVELTDWRLLANETFENEPQTRNIASILVAEP